MRAPDKLSLDERVRDAIKILGPGAKADIKAAIAADIKAAIAAMEAEIELNAPAAPHAPLLAEVKSFRRALEGVRRRAKFLRPHLEEPGLLCPLESETGDWIARCKFILDYPGIKHQRRHRRNDAAETGKREVGLQARLLLVKYGKLADTHAGRRLHNELARILYGDRSADLRKYCKPPFVHAGVGNLISISPFKLRPTRFRARGRHDSKKE
jgi:hypothetical protein